MWFLFNPTEYLTVIEPQNPTIDDSELHEREFFGFELVKWSVRYSDHVAKPSGDDKRPSFDFGGGGMFFCMLLRACLPIEHMIDGLIVGIFSDLVNPKDADLLLRIVVRSISCITTRV